MRAFREQVLVQLAATGINFVDTYFRTGLYPRPVPYTPGGEGAGTVIAVGEGVETPQAGDRVASTELAGSYAQFALAPAERAEFEAHPPALQFLNAPER